MPRGKSERQTPGAGVSTWDFALGRGFGCIWSAAISTTPTARWKKYHFVRLFSREGSALLELLLELQDTGKAGGAFFAEVLAKTSRLAEAYPGYLRRSAGALAVIFAKNIQKEPESFVLPGSLDAVEKISPRT